MQRPLSFVVAGVVLCAAGCGSGAVKVDNFSVTSSGKASCEQVLAAVPEKVADLDRVSVEGSTYAAAWRRGDTPAIVLRCGVEMPPEFSRTSECNMANDVGWFAPPAEADDPGADVTLTTVHRDPAISIDVPGSLRPPAAAMVDLAEVVKQHTRATGSCR